MNVYTHSEPRQNFSMVLDKAESTCEVLIRGKDGRTYALALERPAASPLNDPSIKADVSTREIVTLNRDQRRRVRGRERSDE